MTIDEDKTTSDNIKVPKFDHSNKTISRDTKIKVYLQSFKCATLAKYGTKGGSLFQPLAITKSRNATPPSILRRKTRLTRLFLIIDAHDPKVFKTCLFDEDWKSDSKHVSFAPFATDCFHVICKHYLEQTCSHLIGKFKTFVIGLDQWHVSVYKQSCKQTNHLILWGRWSTKIFFFLDFLLLVLKKLDKI